MSDQEVTIDFDIGDVVIVLDNLAALDVEFTTFVVTQTIGGGGSSAFVHTQASASSLWTVPHNLGYRPSVSVTTVGGVEVLGSEVLHLSDNTLTLTFDDSFAGYARCN
jgi:hypothetical protein